MTSKGHGQTYGRVDEWDMRHNLNTSQFSQGTLFGGGQRVGRGPRGYSSGRMLDVSTTLKITPIVAPKYAWKGGAGQAAGEENVSARREIREEVARSTVPMSDLHPTKLRVEQRTAAQPRPKGMGYNAEAVFSSERGSDKGSGTIHIPEEPRRGTLIHELGHAASARAGLPSSDYDTPAKQGAEEAFADDYSQQHQRSRTGKTQQQRWYPPGGDEFEGAYNAGRKVHAPREGPDPTSFWKADQQPELPGMERDPGEGYYRHPVFRHLENTRHNAEAADAAASRRRWRLDAMDES